MALSNFPGAYGDDYKELDDGSCIEDYGQSETTAKRSFLVLWSLRSTLVDCLLGYGNVQNSAIYRMAPDPHPENPNLFAVSASVKGIGVSGITPPNKARKEYAVVDVVYRPLDYAVSTGEQANELDANRYISRTWTFNADYLTLQGYLQFVTRSSDKAINAQIGRIIPKTELVLTWHDVPGTRTAIPNASTIIATQGRVNNTTFEGIPAGGVLFLGVVPKMGKPKFADTNYTWTLEFRFLILNNGAKIAADVTDGCAGHNYIFDTKNNRFDLLSSDGTVNGNRLYSPIHFGNMFVAPS